MAPTFARHPPPQHDWAFAADTTGRQLRALWHKVQSKGGPLADDPDVLCFVRALRQAVDPGPAASRPGDGGLGSSAPSRPAAATRGDPRNDGDNRHASPTLTRKPSTPFTTVVPASTAEAGGIPAEVVRRLPEAVLSAAICRCGQRVTSPSAAACCAHGLAEVSWRLIVPAGEGAELVAGARGGGSTPQAQPSGIAVAYDGSPARGPEPPAREFDEAEAMGRRATRGGLAPRREFVAETLAVLSIATRFSHTREEMARGERLGAGGWGAAKTFSSLMDALSARAAEIRRRRGGTLRRQGLGSSARPSG